MSFQTFPWQRLVPDCNQHYFHQHGDALLYINRNVFAAFCETPLYRCLSTTLSLPHNESLMAFWRNNWAVIIIAEGYWQCMSPTQLFSKLAESSVSSWEREISSVLTEKPRWLCGAAAHSCQSQNGGLSSTCKVKVDGTICLKTSDVHPCFTLPPITPWGSIPWAPAGCPHLRLMRALMPET